jgi:hypothetical protein
MAMLTYVCMHKSVGPGNLSGVVFLCTVVSPVCIHCEQIAFVYYMLQYSYSKIAAVAYV